MRPVRVTITPSAADPNGIAQAQTSTGGTALTLNGALSGTMDVPRHVSLTSTGNISGRTFAAVGTDRFGAAITETITGPNATTVIGTKNFKTVTSVTPSGAVTGAIEVGSAATLESAWVPLNTRMPVGTAFVDKATGATLTFALQVTMADVFAEGFQENDADVYSLATGKTADFRNTETGYANAIRTAITAHTTGGLTSTYIQGTP